MVANFTYFTYIHACIHILMIIIQNLLAKKRTCCIFDFATRNWNLMIPLNGKCSKQNRSSRMRRMKFSGVLRWKRITESKSNVQQYKKENLPYTEIFRISTRQGENQRKKNERQILWPCQRTKKAVKHKIDTGTNCNWHVWNDPQKFS